MNHVFVSPDTLYAIAIEFTDSMNKHGVMNTPANPDMDNRDRFVILMEEVGEIAKALTYDQSTDGLEQELIQVASVAAAWIEGIQQERRYQQALSESGATEGDSEPSGGEQK